MLNTSKMMIGLFAGAWAACSGSEALRATSSDREPALIAEARPADVSKTPSPSAGTSGASERIEVLISTAAQELASATLAVAVPKARSKEGRALSEVGNPGDVHLVVATTDLAARKRWVVPNVPLPPFIQWGRWLDAHKDSTHCSLDWMDDQGKWWHTELRGYNQHPDEYRVGEGEFPCTGFTIYGVFILPGRTGLEDHELVLDESIQMDYRLIESLAREYGRKDKYPGDPGTGGDGSQNVGLGGPAFKPTQNSNTYISYLLRRAGIKRQAPDRAVGWDTKPHFPYSSDAQE